jgi:hypothetical protein
MGWMLRKRSPFQSGDWRKRSSRRPCDNLPSDFMQTRQTRIVVGFEVETIETIQACTYPLRIKSQYEMSDGKELKNAF